MALGTKAFLFVLSSLLIWAALVASIINGDYIWSAAVLVSRILFDTVLSIPAMLRLKRIDLFPYLIPSIFFFLIVELIAPLFLLKRNVSWKGQVFKERCATL